MEMEKKWVFTKQDTNIAKGLFVIMMVVHHLFFDYDTFAGYDVTFSPFTSHQAIVIAQYFRVCVGGFAFLTFYGLTIKFMKQSKINQMENMVPIILKRYITLVTSFFFVYLIAIVIALLLKKDLTSLYYRDDRSWFGYAVIDALGMAHFFQTPTLNATWWYMSFAVIILFFFPFFYLLFKKLGIVMVVAMIFIPATFLVDQTYFGMCTFSMAMGIWCAQKNLFVKLREMGEGKWYWKVLKAVLCAAVFLITYQLLFYVACSTLYYGISAVLWTYVCFEFIAPVKGLRSIFAFLGKHSLNIFLVHTFLYYYYAKEFIYSFRYGPLVVIVLLAASLIISILIELLKKGVFYSKGVEYLQSKIKEER